VVADVLAFPRKLYRGKQAPLSIAADVIHFLDNAGVNRESEGSHDPDVDGEVDSGERVGAGVGDEVTF
jgi:hypothetical protein